MPGPGCWPVVRLCPQDPEQPRQPVLRPGAGSRHGRRVPAGVDIGQLAQRRSDLYVVLWEPKRGAGGGHKLVTDAERADAVRRQLARERPDDLIRIETAADHAAAAVMERGQ